jgi:hypothetical protein
MFIIDITLKNTPLSLSVQRKSADEAEATFKQILDAVQSGNPSFLQLTCDRQTDKKIAILSSEISAVQMSEKSGTTAASGRPPGFFALAE